MDAVLIIARNCPRGAEYDETSFVGRVHEEGLWDWEEYWLLEQALYVLCGEPPTREMYGSIFRSFGYCFAAFGQHHDPNDGFRITNLDSEELRDGQERLQLVFEGFFEGTMPAPEAFERVNPLLASAGASEATR